jgi:archaeosine synthase
VSPPSAKILVLLPCSAKKPYSLSRSHSFFRKAIKDSGVQHLVHEVMITSPLGIVPRELELFFPAQNYDIPVTGHWSKDEISIIQEDLRNFLEKNKYDHVVAHLGSEKDFVCDVLDDFVSTSEGTPTSAKDLSRLRKELAGLKDLTNVTKGQRQAEDMKSRCVYQFGDGGEVLMESSEIKGRYPNLKIFSDGIQLGMLVQERGMISLTLDGAERISQKDLYCVQIDDFQPEGNLFAIGVEGADEKLRIGDEAAIRYEKDVRAVGSAVMSWREMTESDRGEAVRIRHRKKA